MKVASTQPENLPASQSFRERLREISMFFDKSDKVHQAMWRVCDRLNEIGVQYAIVGGMAVNAHRYVRTTGDVDFLLTRSSLGLFHKNCVPSDFEPVIGHPRRFRDRATGVTFDILVTGLFPGNGKPGPIAYPDPNAVSTLMDGASVVNLSTLIELKLAAGRHKDFGDVVELIRIHHLDEAFQSSLHPSVHGDFIECLEEKRREDEYEARQDIAFEEQFKSDDPPASGV